MEYTIQLQKGEQSLKQELDTLLSTRAGSVPVARDYGIDWSCLDAPPEAAESLFYQELLKKTELYIPDIKIKGVKFAHDPKTGAMRAEILCGRRDRSE